MPLKFLRTGFFIIFILAGFCNLSLEARILSGSRTERKLNRKIERLLKSARKSYEKGQVQTAMDTYWKILEIDPQETLAYLELGEIYYNLRIYDRAVELLEPGIQAAANELDPDTVASYYSVLTMAYIELGQLGQASKALIKAAQVAPENPLPRKILGDIYLANNRIKSAYKAYKKALSFDPAYQPAIEKIAELEKNYAKELQQVKTIKKPRSGSATSTRKPSIPAKEPEKIPETKEKNIADTRPMPLPGKQATSEPAPKPVVQSSKSTESDTTTTTLMPLPVQQSLPTGKKDLKPAQSNEPADHHKVVSVQADPEQIDSQIDKLLAGTAAEKSAAIAFFVALKEDGLIEIEDLLFDSDPEVRIIAIRALTAFSEHKNRVLSILADASDDPDPEVKKEIAAALKALK